MGNFREFRIIERGVTLLTLVMALSAAALAQQNSGDGAIPRGLIERNAQAVVAMRIAAYNSHNIEAYLAAHAEQVEIYVYPDEKIGSGREHLRGIFGPQFARGDGHIIVEEQFVLGNIVISREVATVNLKREDLVVVYTVDAGMISSYRLIETAR